MSDKSSFVLVIPCYNEEKAIPLIFSELCEFSAQFLQLYLESALHIIIVDNNSNDGSWESLKTLATKIQTKNSYSQAKKSWIQKAHNCDAKYA